MQSFITLATLFGAACAAPSVTIQKIGYGPTHFERAPAHDSASIESHRLGGNFAYSTAEAHAYKSVTPEISRATHPVAETTHVHQPAPIKTVHPAAIVKTHHAAQPVFGQQDILAQEPVVGPVRAHTRVHQQVYKQQHVSVHQPIAQVAHQTVSVAQPAVAYAAEPVAVAAEYAQAAPALAYGQAYAAPVYAQGQAYAAPAFAGYAGNYGVAAPAIVA